MTDHFLPFCKNDILRLAQEGTADSSAFNKAATLIDLILGQEFQDRLERLKHLYQPMDPNADTKSIPGEISAADPVAFTKELQDLLGRANYQALTDTELQQAFTTESLFRVKLHTQLDDFREMIIFTRSKRRRTETIKTWFGCKKRQLEVDYFERVLLFVRFQEKDYFPEKRLMKIPFTPGTTQLKLFANVPVADLEMLFPNSEVRMKTQDKLLIGIPALIGIATMSAKILAVLYFLWAGLRWIGTEAGIHNEHVDMGKLWAEAGLVVGAGVAIYLFIGRQMMRYRFKKIQFLQALSDNLYYRNLDNNAGAFHRVLDDAQEEDVKEAVLAYRFLLAAPATADELDATVETWFKTRLNTTLDFEVADGLAKLQRLGLASCDGPHWTAVPLSEAVRVLHAHWQTLAPSQ